MVTPLQSNCNVIIKRFMTVVKSQVIIHNIGIKSIPSVFHSDLSAILLRPFCLPFSCVEPSTLEIHFACQIILNFIQKHFSSLAQVFYVIHSPS